MSAFSTVLPGNDLVKAVAFDIVFVGDSPFCVFAQLVGRVECVGKAEVSDDDVLIAVQQKVLQFEITVDDALLVEIAHTGHKLGKQPPSCWVLQVSVVEDVVEQLASRGILEYYAHVSFCFDKLM